MKEKSHLCNKFVLVRAVQEEINNSFKKLHVCKMRYCFFNSDTCSQITLHVEAGIFGGNPRTWKGKPVGEVHVDPNDSLDKLIGQFYYHNANVSREN